MYLPQKTPSMATVSDSGLSCKIQRAHFYAFLWTASAQVLGGIRLGTSALTSRNMTEEDHKTVAKFLHRTVQLSLVLQKEAGSKLLKDFVRVATSGDGEGAKAVLELKKEVRAFARQWPLPGVDVSSIKRPNGIEEDD